MTPSDFLDLASRLVVSGTEAAFRTAVSRAYYGAFHSAALLIKEMGVSLPIGPESHQKVRYCLMESGEKPGLQAGESLQILRKHRNQADYDLDESTEFNSATTLRRINRGALYLICCKSAVWSRPEVDFASSFAITPRTCFGCQLRKGRM